MSADLARVIARMIDPHPGNRPSASQLLSLSEVKANTYDSYEVDLLK
jgi:hypothetical protein